ncbi:TonB-dependent receptor [Allopusillimonas soli]|uniref:TonB-dependent receptor n=1 Tax=Allopusillimonas soli TaxID=659016 RepID=A0A853FA81_9BURK|nr:TonB-dependent receptor [Allopusillimonas soli]NYT37605.1 TonB-dependent receptor [Allopusillimonas soli]TEA74432.1 TonB-dependent receptor [Allopusillimonas soli]
MPTHFRRLSPAALICLLPLYAASAQSSAPVAQLDEVVVTASRAPESSRNVIGDVSIVDRHMLDTAQGDSVAQILSRQPDIQITANGGPQGVTGLYLRGTNPVHTLVLVDGVRMNSAVQGGFNWQALDPSTIERIEILRGAASSLYGSDAIGGVINIITRKGDGDRPLSAWLNTGLGTHNTFMSSTGLSGASGGWDYAFSSSMADSDGIDATNPNNAFSYSPDRDGYTRHAWSGSLGRTWRAGHRVSLTAYNSYLRGDTDSGMFAEPALALIREQAYTLSSVDDITDAWTSTLRFALTRDAVDSRAAYGDTTYDSLLRSYLWQNDIRFADDQRLTVVLERLEERMRHSSHYDEDKRNTNAAGLIYRGNFGPHHIQANLRNDNITGYGDETTGGLGYDLDLGSHWTVGVSGNTGFRAPTFTDLYYPAAFGYSGNLDLKPERSRNIEGRLAYHTDALRLGMTVYRNKVRDLINASVCDAGGCMPRNVDSATLRGITITGAYTLDDTTIHGSADFLDAQDDNTGEQLIRRARQVYRVGVTQRLHDLSLGAEYQFTGKRYDMATDPVTFQSQRTRLGGYGLLNLTAAYDLNRHAAIQVRWDNVLGRDYTALYGYNTMGSTVFVNLALKM